VTLPAVDTWDVRGVAGPEYKVGPKCSNPRCAKNAEHAHHIIRRSQLAGDYRWVEIVGEAYANLAGLCPDCHDEVTGIVGGHTAAIRLVQNRWWWCLIAMRPHDQVEYFPIAELDPHPPTQDQATERFPEHPVSGSETCPTCGQARRRARPSSRGAARRRKSWTIKVPDDSEDGSMILDTLVDDLALVLGYEGDNGRYYVIVPALVFAQMNRAQFAREIEGMAS
jgi:hypothetical protein